MSLCFVSIFFPQAMSRALILSCLDCWTPGHELLLAASTERTWQEGREQRDERQGLGTCQPHCSTVLPPPLLHTHPHITHPSLHATQTPHTHITPDTHATCTQHYTHTHHAYTNTPHTTHTHSHHPYNIHTCYTHSIHTRTALESIPQLLT